MGIYENGTEQATSSRFEQFAFITCGFETTSKTTALGGTVVMFAKMPRYGHHRRHRGAAAEAGRPGSRATVCFELGRSVGLEPDMRFALREGCRTVAAGVVTEVGR